jgi:hypothetical protein
VNRLRDSLRAALIAKIFRQRTRRPPLPFKNFVGRAVASRSPQERWRRSQTAATKRMVGTSRHPKHYAMLRLQLISDFLASDWRGPLARDVASNTRVMKGRDQRFFASLRMTDGLGTASPFLVARFISKTRPFRPSHRQ